ncbi:MAG: PEP-CTERM sorting domain-containing protein [Verrucomicrobia bacterium]|nr:PEP-CTERM sorting domain-containing protein [Verrucomicrobiota bacterium]
MKRLTTIAALMIALIASGASADLLEVLNHSFESPDIASGGGTTGTDPTSWLHAGSDSMGLIDRNSGAYSTVIDPTPDVDGEQLAWTNGGDFYQVLTSTLAANTIYDVYVDVGDRTDAGFPGADIRLGYGSTFGSNLLTPYSAVNPTPTSEWLEWHYTFTTGASPAGEGQDLRIELVDTGIAQVLFDNVRIDTSVVPEPNSLSMMVLAIAAFVVRRLRK